MAIGNSTQKSAPSVQIVPRPSGVFQIRYHDPASGKEVRLSSGTKDREEAEDAKEDVAAKLRLGIDPRHNSEDKQGRITWKVFRERYIELKLTKKRDPNAAEYRLDIVERVAKPRYADELLDNERVKRLEVDLQIGLGGQRRLERTDDRRPALQASCERSKLH